MKLPVPPAVLDWDWSDQRHWCPSYACEVVFIPVVLLPRVCSSWDVSGEGTKYLLDSCFGFFLYTAEKKGFGEPRAPHMGTQLHHIRCQACANPTLAADLAQEESQDG